MSSLKDYLMETFFPLIGLLCFLIVVCSLLHVPYFVITWAMVPDHEQVEEDKPFIGSTHHNTEEEMLMAKLCRHKYGKSITFSYGSKPGKFMCYTPKPKGDTPYNVWN